MVFIALLSVSMVSSLVMLFIMRGLPVRLKALLFLLSWYSILGRGFAYINIYGVYIGEIVTFFVCLGFLMSKNFRAGIGGFIREPIAKPLVFALMLFAAYLVRSLSVYGREALRDCVLLWYPVFIFFGYQVGVSEPYLNKYLKLLSFVFGLIFLYGITYSFGIVLRNNSPVINAEANAFLFGHYVMNYALITAGIFYYLLLGRKGPLNTTLIIFGITTLIIIGSRAGYLTFVSLVLAAGMLKGFFKYQRKITRYLVVVVFIIVLTGVVVEPSVLTANHLKMSLENICQRFISIFSGTYVITKDSGMREFSEAARGTRQVRLEWALQALGLWKDDPGAWIFGKGFGFNLGEVIGFSPEIRYVHNSYVTLIVVTGLAGFLTIMALHALFVKKALIFIRTGSEERRDVNIILFFLVYQWAFMIVAIFGPLLEGPFLAANLYFIMGVCIGAIKPFKARAGISNNVLG